MHSSAHSRARCPLGPAGAVCRHRRGTPTTQAAGGATSRLPSVAPVQQPWGSSRERLARWFQLFSRSSQAAFGEKTPEAPRQFGSRGAARGSGREQGDPSCPGASDAAGGSSWGSPRPRPSGAHTHPLPCLLVGALAPHSWSLSQQSPVPACITQPPPGHTFPPEPGPGPPPGQRRGHQP